MKNLLMMSTNENKKVGWRYQTWNRIPSARKADSPSTELHPPAMNFFPLPVNHHKMADKVIYTLLRLYARLEQQSEMKDFVTVGFCVLARSVIICVKELRSNKTSFIKCTIFFERARTQIVTLYLVRLFIQPNNSNNIVCFTRLKLYQT